MNDHTGTSYTMFFYHRILNTNPGFLGQPVNGFIVVVFFHPARKQGRFLCRVSKFGDVPEY